MKANIFNELAAALAAAYVNNEFEAVKTDKSYDWQSLTPLADKDAEELNPTVRVSGTAYSAGGFSVTISVDAINAAELAQFKHARERLKAKNLCQLAVEAKLESQNKASEADELLTQAAGVLGIPVEQLDKIVVTETEG